MLPVGLIHILAGAPPSCSCSLSNRLSWACSIATVFQENERRGKPFITCRLYLLIKVSHEASQPDSRRKETPWLDERICKECVAIFNLPHFVILLLDTKQVGIKYKIEPTCDDVLIIIWYGYICPTAKLEFSHLDVTAMAQGINSPVSS